MFSCNNYAINDGGVGDSRSGRTWSSSVNQVGSSVSIKLLISASRAKVVQFIS